MAVFFLRICYRLLMAEAAVQGRSLVKLLPVTHQAAHLLAAQTGPGRFQAHNCSHLRPTPMQCQMSGQRLPCVQG